MEKQDMNELYAEELSVAVQLMRNGDGNESKKSPVLLHCSDLHNDRNALKRIIQFATENEWLITDILHTGDSASKRFIDGMPAFSAEPGAEKILNIVGNHDAIAGESGWDWSNIVSNEELFNMIFAPFCATWGVTIQEKTTYWYKDYLTYDFRLIGIDSTLWGCEKQVEWLKETLSTAKTLGLSVVIATHIPPQNRAKIHCVSASVVNEYTGSGRFGGSLQPVVQEFIDDGGEFVCYLSGHIHTDDIWYNENFPQQLCITVDSASILHSNHSSDICRVEGTKSEDLFNLFSFDTQNKIVKIIRIGANINSNLHQNEIIAINYKTMAVL